MNSIVAGGGAATVAARFAWYSRSQASEKPVIADYMRFVRFQQPQMHTPISRPHPKTVKNISASQASESHRSAVAWSCLVTMHTSRDGADESGNGFPL